MKNREKIFHKQEGKCAICRCELHLDKSRSNENYYLQIDHIIPRSTGGISHLSNYRGLCKPCNSSRGNLIGERLLEVIKDKKVKSKLSSYETRIKDEIMIGNLNPSHLLELRTEIEKIYQEEIELINKILNT